MGEGDRIRIKVMGALFGKAAQLNFALSQVMRLLAVVHVFYRELWPELLTCIRNLGENCEVIVTHVAQSASARP